MRKSTQRTSRRRITSPDEYLATLPAPKRAALQKLRRMIRAAAPKATEDLYYHMPAFRYRVALVCYAAFKEHCSFFVMSRKVLKAHAVELRGYDVIPAGIRFAPDKPLPASLVRTLVKARIAENEARANRRS